MHFQGAEAPGRRGRPARRPALCAWPRGRGPWVGALCRLPGPLPTPAAVSGLCAASPPWDQRTEPPTRGKKSKGLHPGHTHRRALGSTGLNGRGSLHACSQLCSPVTRQVLTSRDIRGCRPVKPAGPRESERKEGSLRLCPKASGHWPLMSPSEYVPKYEERES